jgi:hypothetical protein
LSHTQRTWITGVNTAVTYLNALEADLAAAAAGADAAGAYTLANATLIGDTTVTLKQTPSVGAASLGVVAIGAFTSNCEVRKVSSISGSTLTLVKARQTTATTISFDGPTKKITYPGGLGAFFVGCKIKVTGSASNNGTLTVTALSTDTLSLTVAEAVVTEAAGANVDLKVDLNVAHSAGEAVLWLTGGLIPAEVYGVKASASTGDAATNLAGLQRASNEFYWNSQSSSPTNGATGVKLAPGTTYINGEFFPENGMTVEGSGVDISILKATGITFASTEMAMIHARRVGDPALYAVPGPSSRIYLRNFLVDGSNIASANGILASPQQPAKWETLRVINCPGYGMALCDTQQHVMANIEFTACGTALTYRSAAFVWVDGLNIEQSTVTDFTARLQAGGIACSHNHFVGVHLESSLGAAAKYFDIQSGDGWMFKNVWHSNQDDTGTLFYITTAGDSLNGKPIFTLEDVRANQPSTNFKIVNDVDRGISRTVTAVNRVIQLLVSGARTTSWAQEISGQSTSGEDDPPAFANGIKLSGRIYGGSGAPAVGLGSNGDFYFRTDTPGSVNQRLYVKSAGTWTGIL